MTMTKIEQKQKLKQKQKNRETIRFCGQTINVGIDAHKKNWRVSIYLGDRFVKTFHQSSEGLTLLQHLKTNYPDATYKACYESGFCDFSVQRELTTLGIECIVVNAADIPQTNKGMLSKTDTSDSRRIGEAFAKGLLKPIYIPKPKTESDRNLVRYRKRVQEDLKAKKQV